VSSQKRHCHSDRFALSGIEVFVFQHSLRKLSEGSEQILAQNGSGWKFSLQQPSL